MGAVVARLICLPVLVGWLEVRGVDRDVVADFEIGGILEEGVLHLLGLCVGGAGCQTIGADLIL